MSYLSLYWLAHHHLFAAANKLKGSILWANLNLLFWLSLLPFGTRWLGESEYSTAAMVGYGIILLMAMIAWYMLSRSIIIYHGDKSLLRKAYGSDSKELVSIIIYILALITAPFAK